MKPLKIDATEFSPKIHFDSQSHVFEIAGHSRPEDVRDFYYPVINWLEEFAESEIKYKNEYDENPLKVKFKMEYFNSSSAKFLLDILVEINKLAKKGINTKVEWYFEEGDDDMQEVGEEFSEMVSLPFKYIEMKTD